MIEDAAVGSTGVVLDVACIHPGSSSQRQICPLAVVVASAIPLVSAFLQVQSLSVRCPIPSPAGAWRMLWTSFARATALVTQQRSAAGLPPSSPHRRSRGEPHSPDAPTAAWGEPAGIEVFSTDWSLGVGEDECCGGDGSDSSRAEADAVERFPA